MTWQQIGLATFVVIAFGIIAVLAFDLWLDLSGRTTISAYSRANPWAAWLILTALEFGVLGLAVHFMAAVKIKV